MLQELFIFSIQVFDNSSIFFSSIMTGGVIFDGEEISFISLESSFLGFSIGVSLGSSITLLKKFPVQRGISLLKNSSPYFSIE
jgi:hypothetical protein